MKRFILPLIAFGLILLSSASYLVYRFYGRRYTPPRTYLLGKDYSGLTDQQVKDRLASDFYLPAELKLSYQDQLFSLKLSQISAQIDIEATISSLHLPVDFIGLGPFLSRLFSSRNHELQISYESSQLDRYVASIASQIQQPFVPSELVVTDHRLSYKPGQLGIKVNSAELSQNIINNLISGHFTSPVPIPTETIGRLPTSSQIDRTQTQAQQLLNRQLTLTGDFDPVIVQDVTLISWLDFFDDYNRQAVSQFVANLANSLKRDPVDAVFKFENGQVLEFRPASSGFTVDQVQLSANLPLLANQLALSSDTNLEYAVPLEIIPPQIATGDVNDLGIKELLGSGTSTFKHSSTIRNFNVEKGASIVNRILVPPGETFSFLKNLGEVTLEAGYKKAYIIRQGRTELDVGGGICQVSTTLFRAMLDAGLNITERRPHAFRVSYYEEDSPPGYDATIFIPSPDLKFANDTGHYVLVQNTYDGKEKRLTYEIYGTSDGREVKISNYRQWGYAAPPPTRYIDDPTLAPGQLVKEETAVPGLKVAFDWTVTRNGEVLHQKTFQSNYVPWAAVYRRGI